jgi:hypothetical protein
MPAYENPLATRKQVAKKGAKGPAWLRRAGNLAPHRAYFFGPLELL